MITLDDVESGMDTIIPYLVAPRKGEDAESFIKRAGIKAANKYFKKAVTQAGGNWGGDWGAYGAVGLMNGLSTLLATGDAGAAIESAAKSTAVQAISSKIPVVGGMLSIAEAVASGGDGDEAVMGAASSGILASAGPMGVAASIVPAVIGGVLGNIKSNSIQNAVVFSYNKDDNNYSVNFTGDVEKMRGQYQSMSPAAKGKAASIAKARGDYEDSLWDFSDEEYAENIAPFIGDYELGNLRDRKKGNFITGASARVGLSEDDVQSYETEAIQGRSLDSFINPREKLSGERLRNWTFGAVEDAEQSDIGDDIRSGTATRGQINRLSTMAGAGSEGISDNTASLINKARKDLERRESGRRKSTKQT